MERKKKLPNVFYAMMLVLALSLTALMGGAVCLLDYALKPADLSRNDQKAWEEVYENYPGVKAWHDSLVSVGSLRDTTVTTLGYKMHAWFVPASRPTAATALLLHGYTDCGISMMPIARMYHRDMGMNVMIPDLTNSGRTEVDHYEMGKRESEEARVWSYFALREVGDSMRMVVHGVSMGAATTMMVAGGPCTPFYIKAYVEDCGYSSLDKQYTKELKERFGLPRYPLIPLASWICKKNYGFSFADISPEKHLHGVETPMLFIHGTADTYVPTAMVHEVYAAKDTGVKELWLAPDATHARSFKKYPKEYSDHVRRFLVSNHFFDAEYWFRKWLKDMHNEQMSVMSRHWHR